MKAPLWLPLSRTDTQFVSQPLADVLREFNVNDLPPVLDAVQKILPEGVFIAGGYLMELLAGLTRRDLDLWVTSEAAGKAMTTALNAAIQTEPLLSYDFKAWENPENGSVIWTARGKHPPISLNSSFVFTDVTHVLDSFDFTVAQTAITRDGQVYVGPTTLDDIKNTRLVFHRPQNSIYMRSKRYLQKGFKPTPEAWDTIAQFAPTLGQELQIFKNHAHARAAFETSLGVPLPPPEPPPAPPLAPPPEAPAPEPESPPVPSSPPLADPDLTPENAMKLLQNR